MADLPITGQPRDLLLGPDNDLVMTTTGLSWTFGIAAVAQSCRIAVQMFKGEWFDDILLGIAYFENDARTEGILGVKPKIAILRARNDYFRMLSKVVGVLEIKKLDVTYESTTRTLVITWSVRTAEGDTVLDTIRKATP